MAVLNGQIRRRRRQRVFRDRLTLIGLSDYDLRDYRLTRQMLGDLIGDFARSPFANNTLRSRALTPETQVQYKQYN